MSILRLSSQALHTKIVYKLISKLVNSQTFHIKIIYRLMHEPVNSKIRSHD
jgi:hypothetical protein